MSSSKLSLHLSARLAQPSVPLVDAGTRVDHASAQGQGQGVVRGVPVRLRLVVVVRGVPVRLRLRLRLRLQMRLLRVALTRVIPSTRIAALVMVMVFPTTRIATSRTTKMRMSSYYPFPLPSLKP